MSTPTPRTHLEAIPSDRLHTLVRKVRGKGTPCNACQDQLRKLNLTNALVSQLAPHDAKFILTRNTAKGLLITTSCERSTYETLLALEHAAFPDEPSEAE